MRSMVRKTLFAALLAALLLATLAPVPGALAQTEALVRLSPAELQVAAGETATVDVVVEDVEGLYGFDIRLTFDPAIAEVVDADPAAGPVQVRPGDLLNLDFVVRNEADNDAGTVWFALTQLNPSEAVSGSGVAFSVTFRGLQAGASGTIAVVHAQLASRAGEEIPAATQDGRIEVTAAAEPPGEGTPPPPSPTADEPMPQPTVVTPQPTAPGATPTPGATPIPGATATPVPTEAQPVASPTPSPPADATDVPTPTSDPGAADPSEPTPPPPTDPASTPDPDPESPDPETTPPQPTQTPAGGVAADQEPGARFWLPWLALGLAVVAIALFAFAAHLKRRGPTVNQQE